MKLEALFKHIFVLIILVVFQSCVHMSNRNEKETLHIKIGDNKNDQQVSVHFQFPKYIIDCKKNENVFSVNVPSMRGGMTKFLGLITITNHDPFEYKNIIIRVNGQEINRLSLNDIYNLEKSEIDSHFVYLLNLQ